MGTENMLGYIFIHINISRSATATAWKIVLCLVENFIKGCLPWKENPISSGDVPRGIWVRISLQDGTSCGCAFTVPCA